MNPNKQNRELQDIREILGVIVERMVTKKEFNDALDRMVTKEEFNAALDRMITKKEFSALHEEFVAFEAETRQNFRDVREDIAGLRKEAAFEFDDLLGRVKYVEQKLGIESGK
jgi:phosphoglycolate phosphatase-like HAD superfamily hydrolase